MLPFLAKKAPSTGIIVKTREPDQKESQDDSNEPIRACAQDLITAIHASDVDGAAEAIRSAFEILTNGPDQPEPHSYDAQNQEAGIE